MHTVAHIDIDMTDIQVGVFADEQGLGSTRAREVVEAMQAKALLAVRKEFGEAATVTLKRR